VVLKHGSGTSVAPVAAGQPSATTTACDVRADETLPLLSGKEHEAEVQIARPIPEPAPACTSEQGCAGVGDVAQMLPSALVSLEDHTVVPLHSPTAVAHDVTVQSQDIDRSVESPWEEMVSHGEEPEIAPAESVQVATESEEFIGAEDDSSVSLATGKAAARQQPSKRLCAGVGQGELHVNSKVQVYAVSPQAARRKRIRCTSEEGSEGGQHNGTPAGSGPAARADTSSPVLDGAVEDAAASQAGEEDYALDGSEYIGRYVAKAFGGVEYVGRVAGWLRPTADDDALWHVVYEDGDQEDVDEAELLACAAAHEAGPRRRPPLKRADRHADIWRTERMSAQNSPPVVKRPVQEGAKTPVRQRAAAAVQQQKRPVQRLVSRRGTV
jgi:hypothetical protein